tara:strand:- start:225 stop:713 length:489 start_codon:yes stop_codon:yes gene_type:complete
MKVKILLVIIFSVIFLGCNDNIIYREFINLGESWSLSKKVSFKIDKILLNTNDNYDIYIHLRNNNEYQYNNIFLIGIIKDSINIIEKDTLEYAMADSEGKWLGKGFLSLKESKLWWKSNYRFTEVNSLIFEIDQVTRKNGSQYQDEDLKGIIDIGLSIEISN